MRLVIQVFNQRAKIKDQSVAGETEGGAAPATAALLASPARRPLPERPAALHYGN